MVQLLPHDRFNIQTPEAVQTVIKRVAAHVEPRKTVRWTFDRNHAPYEGSVSEAGFKMRRIPKGRNSFVPEIEGHFTTPPGGTVVHITLKLHPLIPIFMGCWSFIWYGITFLIWSSGNLSNELATYVWVLPLLVFMSFWIAFWLEVERSRNDLLQMILGRQYRRNQNQRLVLISLQIAIVLLNFILFFRLVWSST